MINLVYQTYVTEGETPKFAKISSKAFEDYAKLHEAEYRFNDKLTFETDLKTQPYFERYRIIYDESFDVYDNILYVDSDVYPHDMSANIFEIENTGIACMPERDEPRKNWTPGFNKEAINDFWGHYNLEPEFFEDGQVRWYNTGVLLVTREMRKTMREMFITFKNIPENLITKMNYDESWFGVNLTKTKLPVTHLDVTWNWTGQLKNGIVAEDAKFLHFSGGKLKKLMEFDYAHILRN